VLQATLYVIIHSFMIEEERLQRLVDESRVDH